MGAASRRRRAPRARRRRVLALFAALATLVSGNTALEAANRAAFPSTTTTGVSPQVRGVVPPEGAFWVFFPGFGIDFCPDVERAFAPVTAATGASFCVAPSPARLDPAEIAATVRARVTAGRGRGPGGTTPPVTLYLYGISMGGMIAYDVARLLDGRDEITVRALVFDSSPAGPDSVAGAKKTLVRLGAAIERLPDLPGNIPNPLKGGPLNRFAAHVAEAAAADVQQRRPPDWARDIEFAWYKATRVTSDGVAAQLAYIEGFYPRRDPAALPYAEFAYLRADDPDADTTVDVQRAVASYAGLVAPRRLATYPIRGGFHASADTTVASYREALAAFSRDVALPSRQDEARVDAASRGARPLSC